MGRYFAALVFASSGVALLGVNIANNAAAINGGEMVFNDLTAVVGGMAIASALLSLSIGAVARQSRIVALATLFAIVGCTATSVHYTLSRIGGVADAGSAVGDDYVRKSKLIEAAIAERKAAVALWEQKLTGAELGVARECNGKPPKTLDRPSWPNCRGHDDDADLAREKIAGLSGQISSERQALIALGAAPVTDPAAKRIEALTGMPAVTYRNALPVVTAVSLETSVNLLFLVAGVFGAGRKQKPQPVHAPMKDVTPVDPVVAALEKRGRPVNNGELAGLLGWSDATAHRRVAELVSSGQVSKTRNGREVVISLN